MEAVKIHGAAMRRLDDLRLRSRLPETRKTDRLSDEALERGRKKRAIEIIAEARELGEELMEFPWDDE